MNPEKIRIALNGKSPSSLFEVSRILNITKSEVLGLLYEQEQNLNQEIVILTATPKPTAFERYGWKLLDVDIIEK